MKKNYWKVLVLGVLVLGVSVSPAHANNEGVIEENTCTAIAQRRVVDEDSAASPTARTPERLRTAGAATTTR
jgi:hypothetical protein